MWPYPKIVAHRGGGTLAPENTIAGLRAGLAYGFRAVEFDVMLSSDGIGVVMHDQDFGRTIYGDGFVPNFAAAELAKMDAADGSVLNSAASLCRCSLSGSITARSTRSG